MSVRAKTKKRLVILLVVTGLIVGACVSFYTIQKHRRNQRILSYRETGMAAYEAGDYGKAVYDLQKYLHKYQSDVDALFSFAMSVKNVPQDGSVHLGTTMNLLTRVLSIDPDYPQAGYELIELYDLLGQNVEAIDLADKLLSKNPDDQKAKVIKANALHNLRRLDQARELLEEVVAVDELDMQSQMRLFDILANQGVKPSGLVDRATVILEDNPDDPRAELLLASAYYLADDRARSVEMLLKSAGHPYDDEQYTGLLVGRLDMAGLYEESLRVLKEAVVSQEIYHSELVHRLWENGFNEEVLQQTEIPWPPILEKDIELFGVRGMVLYQLDRTDQAGELVKKLSELEDRSMAQVWSTFLEEIFVGEPTSEQVVLACRKATDVYPKHAYFNFISGDAYSKMGEHDLALKAWANSVRSRPTWALPRSRRLESLIALGRMAQAKAEAFVAVQLRLKSNSVFLDLVMTQAAGLDWSDHQAVEQLLLGIEQVHVQVPHERRTLNLYVRLLSSTGQKDKAIEILSGAIESGNEFADEQLIDLASLSRAWELGMESACYDFIKRQSGMTPSLALVMSNDLLLSGDKPGGMAFMEQAMLSRGSDSDYQWQKAWAVWLEMADDSRVMEAMVSLGNDYPQDMQIQQLVLRSKAAQDDREFADKTIKRLREITGDGGLIWRIARARWLMQDNGVDSISQAVAMLEAINRESPRLFEPQLMIAQCFERMGNSSNAIESYIRASELRPDVLAVYLSLARVRQQMRDYDGVLEQLDIVVSDIDATTEQLKEVAGLYAGQGEYRLAIEAMELAYAGVEAPPDELLGDLYRRVNDHDKVEAICASLISQPTVGGIFFVADYYASRGEKSKAEEALSHLEEISLAPGTREMVLAEYTSRFSGRDEATEYYRKAAAAGAENIEIWKGLIVNLLSQGKVEESMQAVADARAALPGDESIAFMSEHEALIRKAGAMEDLRSMVVAMLRDANHRDVATKALTVVVNEQPSASVDERLLRLRQLAESKQGFAALQFLMVRQYLTNGEYDPAIEIAARAMDTFPTSSTAAQLAIQAARGGGRWGQVLVAAKRWREVSASQQRQADTVIAEAMIMLADSAGALRVLEPYVKQGESDPSQWTMIFMLYTRALVELGEIDKASEISFAMADSDAQWRSQCMQLAVRNIKNQLVAWQWLERVEGYIPVDSTPERIELSQSYAELYYRSGDEKQKNKAMQVIEAVVAREDADALAWSFYGLLSESVGELSKAERGYRKALELNEQMHVICNNLAMVLVNSGGDLDEANDLAAGALKAVPDSADYLDTMAQVQAARGEYEKAIGNLQQALEIKPDNEVLSKRLSEYIDKTQQ